MASARRTRPAGRPIRQHLSVLWPRLGPPLLALAVRIPHEPTRRKLTLIGLHDTAAAFNRGDLEGAFAGLDPGVQWETPPGFPDSGALNGRRAVHDFYESQIRDWARAELQYDSVERVDARAIVTTWHLRFEGAETNLGFEMHGSQTFEIERGRIVRAHATLDGSRSLDAN
jgi:ketosteroid isomerase-like protein